MPFYWISSGCGTMSIFWPAKKVMITIKISIFKFIQISNSNSEHEINFKDIKKEVKSMLDDCIDAIAEVRKCCDCYFNRDQPNAIELVCSKPHLVLWVRYGNHPWWPAKLLSVGNGKYPLEVEFFGDFSSATVTYTDCLLYSYVDPNTWLGDVKDIKFYQAINVNKFIFQKNFLHLSKLPVALTFEYIFLLSWILSLR